MSFEQWGYTLSAGYLAQSNVVLVVGEAANTTKIARQRYLAHYPDGRMGWNIYRETGVPALTLAPEAAAGSTIPRRFRHTTTEYSTNPSVNEDVARLTGGDQMSSKIWWDQ